MVGSGSRGMVNGMGKNPPATRSSLGAEPFEPPKTPSSGLDGGDSSLYRTSSKKLPTQCSSARDWNSFNVQLASGVSRPKSSSMLPYWRIAEKNSTSSDDSGASNTNTFCSGEVLERR